MKRTLLLSALAGLFFAGHTIAQPVVGKVTKMLPKVTVGVKLGANFQQLTGNSWDNGYKPGFVGGGFVGVTKGKIGVQGEVLVKSAQFDVKGTSNATVKTVSLDIPILFEYKIVSRLWLQVGPQFSTMISAKQNSTDVKKSFNTTDFSAVLGVQANLPMHLTAGARYVLGVTDINNTSVTGTKDAWNNRSIQLYIGYRFL